jgi:para-nitrobenzyl esterase
MKKITLFAIFILLSQFLLAQAPVGCDGKRYLLDVFPDTTMTTVKYGNSKSYPNTPTNLNMTIVQPKGDVLKARPVVILAFGGGFVGGKRQDMLAFCHAFAKKGYVAVTIDYRLFSFAQGFPDSTKITPVIVQAAQDMKAAIRYFYKDAQTVNQFKIDTNKIIIGGVSAGAITAMVAGQLDETDPIAPWVKKIVDAEGGIEGQSGNQGYSSKVCGILNMSGALYQKEWLDKGDVPFISYHGTIDDVVAYGYGKNVYGFYGNGSGTLYPEAKKLGIPAVLVTVKGGGHTDIYDEKGKFSALYFDFLSRMILFTKQLACGENIEYYATDTKEINETAVKIYPNPANEDMTFSFGNELAAENYTVQVFDISGRMVFEAKNQNTPFFNLKKSNIGTGLFFTKINFHQTNTFATKKIIFE